MIEKYGSPIIDKHLFEADRDAAFAKLRSEIQRWKQVDRNCQVALGSESDSGEWSVVFEDGFWLAFVGERGDRHQVCLFTNVWDAVSYAGYRAVLATMGDPSFPLLRPSVSLE